MLKKFYYISGIPATGKSTLIQLLKANEFPNVFFIPEFLEPLPEFVYRAEKSSFYAKCKAQEWIITQHALKTQMGLSDQNHQIILMERGLVDALAFSWALGQDIYSYSLKFAEGFEWVQGKVILLDASDNAIKSRIMSRDNLTESDWQNYWQPYFRRVREGYQKIRECMPQFNFIDINTETEQPESYRQISSLLKENRLFDPELSPKLFCYRPSFFK